MKCDHSNESYLQAVLSCDAVCISMLLINKRQWRRIWHWHCCCLRLVVAILPGVFGANLVNPVRSADPRNEIGSTRDRSCRGVCTYQCLDGEGKGGGGGARYRQRCGIWTLLLSTLWAIWPQILPHAADIWTRPCRGLGPFEFNRAEYWVLNSCMYLKLLYFYNGTL